MLFDNAERSNPSPAQHGEDHFTFLNRVATPYWERVRYLLTDWIGRVPENERADLVGRLRSRDTRQFLGAFWEMYLLVTFQQLGYSVTIHPEVSGTERRPDFYVETPHGPAFVEATISATSDWEMAREENAVPRHAS